MVAITLYTDSGELAISEVDGNWDALNEGKQEAVSPATATADTMTLAYDPTETAYQDGRVYQARAGATNTGAATLNIDSLGAKDVKYIDGTALKAGAVLANNWHHFLYDSTADDFYLLNPTQPGQFTTGHGAPSTLTYYYEGSGTYKYELTQSSSASTWLEFDISSKTGALSNIPSGCKSIFGSVNFGSTLNSTAFTWELRAREEGSTVTDNVLFKTEFTSCDNPSTNNHYVPFVEFPVNPDNNKFDYWYNSTGASEATWFIQLVYIGFRI